MLVSKVENSLTQQLHELWNILAVQGSEIKKEHLRIRIINSRTAIAEAIIGASFFLQLKEFELYWGALAFVFFKICSHIFMIFEVKLEKWFWSRRNRK